MEDKISLFTIDITPIFWFGIGYNYDCIYFCIPFLMITINLNFFE